MRRYEWYSPLPPERVRTRLLVLGGPQRHAGDPWGGPGLLVKVLPDGRFSLLKTGGAWALRPQFPFVGTVTPWGTGSLIAGGFSMPRSGWGLLALLGAAAAIAAAAMGVPPPAALAGVLLWLALAWGLAEWVGGDPSNPRSRETLALLEEELLRE